MSSATRVPCTIHLFHSPPANPISPGGERRPSDGDDRVFSVPYMLFCLLPLLLIVLCFPKSSAPARINTALSLFTLALLVVPVMDAVYVKGVPRLYDAFDVTVAATVMRGVVDALVQGGVIGFAGELPERYVQAVVARTGALVSAMIARS